MIAQIKIVLDHSSLRTQCGKYPSGNALAQILHALAEQIENTGEIRTGDVFDIVLKDDKVLIEDSDKRGPDVEIGTCEIIGNPSRVDPNGPALALCGTYADPEWTESKDDAPSMEDAMKKAGGF